MRRRRCTALRALVSVASAADPHELRQSRNQKCVSPLDTPRSSIPRALSVLTTCAGRRRRQRPVRRCARVWWGFASVGGTSAGPGAQLPASRLAFAAQATPAASSGHATPPRPFPRDRTASLCSAGHAHLLASLRRALLRRRPPRAHGAVLVAARQLAVRPEERVPAQAPTRGAPRLKGVLAPHGHQGRTERKRTPVGVVVED